MLSTSRDISIDLSCFLMKLSGIWLAANRQEQIYRNIALTYTVVTLSFGVYVDIADFYNTWGDVSNCLYMACNILCIGMGLYKTGILFIHKLEFADLVLYAQRNFWHSNYDDYEKSLIAECRKFFTACVTFTYFVTPAVVVNYALTPIVGESVDLTTLCVCQIAVCYVCFDNFLCMINVHVACQFRILQYRMSKLWVPIDEQTDVVEHNDRHNVMFKRCVRQHQALIEYCRKIEKVFTLTVLGHLLVFSVLMCLVGYQIFMAESSTPRRLIFILHITGSFFQIVLFTYTCDGLIEESSNIGMAVYSAAWTTLPMDETGRSFRKDMQLIIMRSKHPCYLSAGGFFPVSLETSTAVLSSAMSYFTLLTESSTTVQQQ
ncbi:odorant receptor 13a-like [Andrena cerasifolii]|uniref:odorant receptor 13a-like n=1 Tax=Andrena cerasifolii TaxID=2819439 RepID=UPI0040378878